MMSAPQNEKEHWHLSKSFNITQVLAIIAQTIALIWFVLDIRNDVDNSMVMDSVQNERILSLEITAQGQEVMLGRIDENLKAIRDAIERLDRR
jgi:hypothetical protein